MAGPSTIISKFPIGLKEHTIGFAVANSDPIDIRFFSKRLDFLTAPFSADLDLVAVAGREALSSNTFCLDGDDTIVEWLSADIAQTSSRWARAKNECVVKKVSEGSADPIAGLNFTPHLFSATKGQISNDVRQIRHLLVKFSITVEGGDMDDDGGSSTVGQDKEKLLRCIPEVFPRLESLTVSLENTGEIRPGATYVTGGKAVAASEMPLSQALEHYRKVDDFCEILDSLKMTRTRRVCKKSLRVDQRAVPQEIRDESMVEGESIDRKMVEAQKCFTADFVAIEFD